VRKVRKVVLAGVAATGLAVSGCSSNVVGAEGPHPGVAFEVDGSQVTLDELADLTSGYCTLTEQDAQLGATSRAFAQRFLLERWVDSAIVTEFAEEQGIDAREPRTALHDVPGWNELTEDEQAAVEDYVTSVGYAQTVREAAGDDQPDLADYDVVINPKFDAEPVLTEEPQEHFALEPAGSQLSFGVSDLAVTSVEEPAVEEVADLPDAELCGQRPQQPPPAPMPMG
jgi:hypothetical protein